MKNFIFLTTAALLLGIAAGTVWGLLTPPKPETRRTVIVLLRAPQPPDDNEEVICQSTSDKNEVMA